MKKLLSILAFALVHFAVFAQPAILEKGIKPKRGIYKTFQEFKNNAPSISAEFEIHKTTKGYGFMNATLHNTFKIVLKDPKALSKNDAIWGVCDGDSIYVCNNEVYKKRNLYDKLIYINRYCIFETVETHFGPGIGPGIMMMPVAGGGMMPMGGGGSSRTLNTMGININNGAIFDLSKSSLREILQKDAELSNEFELEKKKKDKLQDYLIKYSEKHQEEIKLEQ